MDRLVNDYFLNLNSFNEFIKDISEHDKCNYKLDEIKIDNIKSPCKFSIKARKGEIARVEIILYKRHSEVSLYKILSDLKFFKKLPKEFSEEVYRTYSNYDDYKIMKKLVNCQGRVDDIIERNDLSIKEYIVSEKEYSRTLMVVTEGNIVDEVNQIINEHSEHIKEIIMYMDLGNHIRNISSDNLRANHTIMNYISTSEYICDDSNLEKAMEHIENDVDKFSKSYFNSYGIPYICKMFNLNIEEVYWIQSTLFYNKYIDRILGEE